MSTQTISNSPATAPSISGAQGSQVTPLEAAVTPFGGVTIGDANVGATDTLTISLSNGGAGGALAGAGLSGGTGGVYTLSGPAATLTSQLRALTFTPAAGQPNTTTTTTFTLSDASSAYATPTINSTTTVTDIDPAVAPTISGTAGGQTTSSRTPPSPFAGVTIGDANVAATDTLTISLSNGGAGGALSGAGLAGGTGGVYTLTGSAATITSELDALTFTPAAGQPNTSAATAFTLSDVSSAYAPPIVLASFNQSNGYSPESGLIADAAGDLFGTTDRKSVV